MLAVYNALGFIVIPEISNKIFWVNRKKFAILEFRKCYPFLTQLWLVSVGNFIHILFFPFYAM